MNHEEKDQNPDEMHFASEAEMLANLSRPPVKKVTMLAQHRRNVEAIRLKAPPGT